MKWRPMNTASVFCTKKSVSTFNVSFYTPILFVLYVRLVVCQIALPHSSISKRFCCMLIKSQCISTACFTQFLISMTQAQMLALIRAESWQTALLYIDQHEENDVNAITGRLALWLRGLRISKSRLEVLILPIMQKAWTRLLCRPLRQFPRVCEVSEQSLGTNLAVYGIIGWSI